MAVLRNLKVFIIEATAPRDFYTRRMDGIAARALLNILGISNELRLVLDQKHLERALQEARRGGYNVLHLSCHGGEDGIEISNSDSVTWSDLSSLFQQSKFRPRAIVMSACCGATTHVRAAFKQSSNKPEIIFGSIDRRDFGDYVVAWTLLYREFVVNGLSKASAQTALKQIHAVGHKSFLYYRWDGTKYRVYPYNCSYNIFEVEKEAE